MKEVEIQLRKKARKELGLKGKVLEQWVEEELRVLGLYPTEEVFIPSPKKEEAVEKPLKKRKK